MISGICSTNRQGNGAERGAFFGRAATAVLIALCCVSIPAAHAADKMYWTDRYEEAIRRANVDGSDVEDLVTSGGQEPLALALDVANGKMYWTDKDNKAIRRANVDGSNVEDLVTTGIKESYGLALDVAGGKMYWTDKAEKVIRRANLDGTNMEDVIASGLDEPLALALDLTAGKMYWGDKNKKTLCRANLDGSNIEQLVSSGIKEPYGLALDVAGGKMYWTDKAEKKIRRANLDGSTVEDVITGLEEPLALALDVPNGKMYWTEKKSHSIFRADLDGSNIEVLLSSGVQEAYGLALALNVTPTANDDTGSTNEDTVLNVAPDGVLANDTGGSLPLEVIGHDDPSANGAAVTVNADGSYTYDPTSVPLLQALAVGESLVDTFTYTMTNADGDTDNATVSITVTGVNDDPTAADDEGWTAADAVLSVPAAGVLVNDDDIDTTDVLTVSDYDSASTYGATVTVGSDGAFSYDPTASFILYRIPAGYLLIDTFSYTVSDGNGGAAVATVTVTVTGVNDPPAAVDDTGATDARTVLSVPADGVLGNDSDVNPGDVLAVTGHDAASANGALVTVNADGSYTYDPTTSAALQALPVGVTLVDTFHYTATDNKGTGDDAVVRITVSGMEAAPVATDDTGSTDAETLLSVPADGVLENDTDPNPGDHPVVADYEDSSANGATVTVYPSGGYVYDPRTSSVLQALRVGETFIDTFDYTITDLNGGWDTATVSVAVAGVNEMPQANDDTAATDANALLSVPPEGVLANDIDPDGGGTLTVAVYDDTSANGAAVTVMPDGGYTYDPTGAVILQSLGVGKGLIDTFRYIVGDGSGGSDTATVGVAVTGVAQPPTAAFTGDPSTGEEPLVVHFSDLSERGSFPIHAWEWSFGDGGSSFEQHPTHTYQNPGTYEVSLMVSTVVDNSIATEPEYITVGEATPVPAAGPVGLCVLALLLLCGGARVVRQSVSRPRG